MYYVMGKTDEERKELPPWDLETTYFCFWICNFRQLEKVLGPIVIQLSPFVCKKSTAAGADFGAYKYLPNCFSLSPKKKKHDRFQASRVAMAQKTTARFEHFTEFIIIKCNITIWLKDFWVSSILTKTNKNKSTWGIIVLKVEFFRSFFGRIQNANKSFRN